MRCPWHKYAFLNLFLRKNWQKETFYLLLNMIFYSRLHFYYFYGFHDMLLQTFLLQLKKETVNSAVQWTAGCANCTGSPSCTASTQPPCFLECCIASKTSCLMLNGTLNVPSFAVKGPHTQLITYLLCVISSAALFFIL